MPKVNTPAGGNRDLAYVYVHLRDKENGETLTEKCSFEIQKLNIQNKKSR